MFPISIKIVVEEDAVDFGLHLTVPDKPTPPPFVPPILSTYTHTLSVSPYFINDRRPPPLCPNEKEK